jgi:hypothetical protein
VTVTDHGLTEPLVTVTIGVNEVFDVVVYPIPYPAPILYEYVTPYPVPPVIARENVVAVKYRPVIETAVGGGAIVVVLPGVPKI